MEIFSWFNRRSNINSGGGSFTSTPPTSLSSSVSAAVVVKSLNTPTIMMSNQRESGAGSPPPFLLADLDDVPVDKIISYLDDEDLRRFHRVCRSWKEALESRPRENRRRLELVRRIKENKENIRLRREEQELAQLPIAQRQMRQQRSSNALEDKNPDNAIFMECTNIVTPTSANTTTDANSFLTPSPFKFQEFEEAEKYLEPGQKLLSCRKCRGPVPSPATPVVDSQEFQESRRRSSQPTRCKLTSRLDYHQSSQPDSPKKPKCKKARTLSSVDLSPIPPVTIASLGEQFVSLAMSSPCLNYSSNTTPLPLPSPQGFEFERVKRSTSCSSITGIDLPQHDSAEVDSPIDLHLNISSYDNSPFYASHPPSHHPQNQVASFSGDLNDSVFNCSRSCCSPRKVHNSQLHSSQFSDSGLSFDGDSIDEYSNMIFSPDAQVAHASSRSNRNSIERARDISTNHFSDGALSLSSFSHLQRSDPSLNFSSFDNNDQSVFANVLECPNPKCGYRFCSNCEEGEHPGRSCHMLSSDQFESFYFEGNNNSSLRATDVNRNSNGYNSNNNLSRENINSSCSSSKSGSNKKSSSSSSSKSSKHKNSKKTPLRRLARL